MSRYNTTLVFLIIILFSSCAHKEVATTPLIGKKSFDKEDILILYALEYQRDGRYVDAGKTFEILYKKSRKKIYLTQEIKMYFVAKKYKKTYALLKNAIKIYPENIEFKKLLVDLYIKEKKYKDAEKISLKLLSKNKTPQILSVLGDIYMMEKSYDLALKYYQSAFKMDSSSSYLVSMANLLYNHLDRKEDAISYLETFIRLHDASKEVYITLLKFYGQNQDIDGLISVYKRMYYKYKIDQYAKKVIELLVYKRDTNGAISFLEKSSYNPKMLMDIYISKKDFKNAYKIAQKLYKQTNNSDYLGKMAIYEYEANANHISRKILSDISKKFELALKDVQDPLYLNYYGYLLIDNDIDIKKGIKLVKLALKKEPESVYYLDSLAWGYYKLKKCKQALSIMNKFIKENREPEVIMHYKKILKCIKEGK